MTVFKPDILKAWVKGHPITYQSPTTDEWFDVPDVTKLSKRNRYNRVATAYLDPSPFHPEYARFRYEIKSARVGKPHKNADLILAWLNGAPLEVFQDETWKEVPSAKSLVDDQADYLGSNPLNPKTDDLLYRIKT